MGEGVGAVKTKNIASIGFDLATGLNQLQTLRDAVDEASAEIQSKLHIKLPEGDVTLTEKQITQIATFRAKQDAKAQVQIETNRIKGEQRVSEFARKNQISLDAWRTKQKEKQLAYERMLEKQSLEQSNGDFKSMMANRLGWIAASAIYREIGDFFNETIEATKDVEMRMVAIDRVMSDTAFSVDEYRQKLIQLAKDLGTSFTQVSDVYLEWARAGYTAEDALEATRVSILGMNTQQLKSEEVTTKMIGIMAQWNMEANDMADVLDKVAKMADVTALDASDLVEMLVRSSSAAKTAGLSFDELVALLTTMKVESGRTANVVGTAANSMMVYLSRTANAEKLAALGVDFYTDETRNQMRPLIEIIKDLSVVWKNNKEASESFFESMITDLQTAEELTAEEAESLRNLVGTRNQNIFLALLDGMDEYEDKLEDIASATGYSQTLQEKYMDTIAAKQEQLNSTILELQMAIADAGLYDLLESFIKFGTGAVGSIKEIVGTFGLIPTATTAAALGLSLFGKNLKLVEVSASGISLQINTKWKQGISNVIKSAKAMSVQFKEERTLWLQNSMQVSKMGATSAAAFNTLRQNILSSSAAMKVLNGVAKATGAVVNTVFTMGIGLVVGEIMNGVIQLWDYIKDTEKTARENALQAVENAKDTANAAREQAQAFQDALESYDELSKKHKEAQEALESGNGTQENTAQIAKELLNLQEKINKSIQDEADYVDLVNGKYDEQRTKMVSALVSEQGEANAKAKAVQESLYAKYKIGIKSDTSRAIGGKAKFELDDTKGTFEEQLNAAIELYKFIAYDSAASNKNKKAAMEMLQQLQKDLAEYQSYDIIGDTTETLKTVLDSNVYTSVEDITELVNKYGTTLGLTSEQIQKVVDSLVDYQNGLNDATGITNDFENEAIGTLNSLEEFNKGLDETQKGINNVFNAMKKLADGGMPSFDEWLTIFDEYPEVAKAFVDSNGDMKTALDELYDRLQGEQTKEIQEKLQEIQNKLYNYDENGNATIKEGLRETTKENLQNEIAYYNALLKLIAENYEKEKYYAEKITDLKIDELNKQKNALEESYEAEDKEREKAELRARGDYESMQKLAEIARDEQREAELAKYDQAIQAEKEKLEYALATGDYSILKEEQVENFAETYESYMKEANSKIATAFGLDLKTMLDGLKTEYGLKIVNFTIETQNNYNDTDADVGATFANGVIEGIGAASGN